MIVKIKFYFFLLLCAGSFALPKPIETGLSEFFIHADPEARVVGGTVAIDGSAPYMAALSFGAVLQSFICGASIISTRTALTAAHCTQNIIIPANHKRDFYIRVGTNYQGSGGATYNVSQDIPHPEYMRTTIKNDLVLLILDHPIALSARVQPIALSFDWVPADVVCKTAGWGRIGQGLAMSQQLLELNMSTVAGDQCASDMTAAALANNMITPPVDPQIELCTVHSPGHGLCNGDSGSALVRVDSGEQVGVVSWGLPCARGAPDVFVRLSAYRGWLSENVVY